MWSAPLVDMLTDESCAIVGYEPCQMGDQAALSSCDDVPRECLSRADATGTRMEESFRFLGV